MEKFKVSVLIPTYNQEDVIEQTLRSSLEQNYENLEVVVTDDASIDKTPQILKEWQARFPHRLRVFLHKTNLGVTKNHTQGLLECRGDFIAFLDGDDLFLPGKIEKQIAFMLDRDDCTICCHDVDVFNTENGETLYFWSERFGFRGGGLNTLVRFGNYLPSVSVMVRRKDLPPYGYDDRIRVGSDWLLWLETLANGGGKIYYLDEVLAKYRRHGENLTNVWNWKFEDQLITLSLVDIKWPNLLFSARMRRSEIYFMQATDALSHNLYGNFGKYLGASLILGFPIFMPWLRLVWREIGFLLRSKNDNDDILRNITSRR